MSKNKSENTKTKPQNFAKCQKCEYFDKTLNERTDKCPNKDSPACDFSACTDFLISEKLVHF